MLCSNLHASIHAGNFDQTACGARQWNAFVRAKSHRLQGDGSTMSLQTDHLSRVYYELTIWAPSWLDSLVGTALYQHSFIHSEVMGSNPVQARMFFRLSFRNCLNECKYMKHIFELRMKDQIEERSSQLLRNLRSCEKKAWKKKTGLNGIRTHDLCDAGAVLYQRSYQANWKLVILWVRNIPVKDEFIREGWMDGRRWYASPRSHLRILY